MRRDNGSISPQRYIPSRDFFRFVIADGTAVNVISEVEAHMTVGQTVTAISSLGKVERVVVEDLGQVVRICRKSEYEAAQREGRPPTAIALKRSDIIEHK